MSSLGSITLNEIQIFEVSADPSETGLVAATGSLAILTDGSKMFLKKGEGDTDWTSVSPNPKYTNSMKEEFITSSTTYISISNMETDLLPVGLYKFEFNCKINSVSGADDIRIKLQPSADNLESKYAQGNILTLDDASECIVSGYGIFRINSPVSLSMQVKSEVPNNIITVKPDSILIIEPL